jgi:uncharacterized protein
MRVVLDTNVLISGLMFPKSVPGTIVRTWRDAGFELVMCREQLEEIARVLAYPKIVSIMKWDATIIARFVKQLYLRSEVLNITDTEVDVPGDPHDDPILAMLVAGHADCVVSGDGHLPALRDRYRIVSPSEFVRMI